MTNSESHFIEEVYSFSIALRGSGRKRKIPFLLDEGTPITFNGHQSLGEYASYLNQLLSQIREELCQTRSPHSQVLALIMADLAVLLESRRLLPLNEKHFDKSWSTVIKMPELMEEIETKTALFRETQYYAFRRWEAMRKSLEGFTTAKNFIDNDRCNDPEGPFGFGSNVQATTTYNWTGTLTDAVEVSLGLVDAGLIQFPAKATQEQKLQSLAIAFRMEIGQANLNQTLSQAERPTLEPNQCNSLICNRSRGLHFTLGLQFGIAVLRGFFTNMRFISLCFTGFERKSQMGRNRT